MEFPEPVIDIAIEPKTKASQDKMGDALVKLAEEDPTFRVRTDEETGQTIISGMGELHLDIIVAVSYTHLGFREPERAIWTGKDFSVP